MPRYNNVNNESFMMAWQKMLLSRLDSKFLTKNLPILIYERHFCSAGIAIQSNKELGSDYVLFWITLGWLVVWFFGGRHNFTSLSLCFVPFLLTAFWFFLFCFFDFALSIFFATIIFQRCSTVTAKLLANFMGHFCCRHSGVQSLCFIGQLHDSVDCGFNEVWEALGV